MKINKLLTEYNHNDGDINRIKYIVIHYVGATGSAEANCKWYASGDKGSSAHYFVNFDGEIWQSVEDKDIAWHCGAKAYYHPECRNANSIGIELCVRNKGDMSSTSRDWYFEDDTIKSAIELTKELMKKYNIDSDHVLRHYDVTHKICPNPFVYNDDKFTWDDFKQAINGKIENKSGWYKESDGWHFYLGDTGKDVKNDWHLDGNGKWSWFDASGVAIHDTWYQYKNHWYYFDTDCYMLASEWIEYKGNQYYLTADGTMSVNAYIKSKDPICKLYYWVNSDGIWEPKWNTENPDLSKYKLDI